MVQWLRIRLPMQGTGVQALFWEDPTCHGATKPVRHNYSACVPQLLKPTCLEPVLHNKTNHLNEKPAHRNEEKPPLATTRESQRAATKTQCSQKLKKKKKSLQIINVGEGVEKREPSYTAGGNVNWCSHYGKQYGGSSKN